MTTRRGFLGGAGAVFCSCCLLEQRQAMAQATPRREVSVGGKRVKTIDFHAHVWFPEAAALVGAKVTPPSLVMADARLRAMDAQGIDMEALSINRYHYEADRDTAAKFIKLQNEKLAELVAARPDRFVAFASVSLQHPDMAAQQLDEAVKKLGLKGAGIGGSVGEFELADPKFDPFWAKVQELDVPVFIHPDARPEFAKRLAGNGGLVNTIGNPLETTIALSHLIYQGTLDKFPNLKICSAHGGGYLPSYADRSDAICVTFPDRCKDVTLKKKPTEYLKQMYYDTLVFTPAALRHLAHYVGVNQLVMGTDYPFPWTKVAVDHILGTPGFSDDEKIAMLGGTAAKLLKITA